MAYISSFCYCENIQQEATPHGIKPSLGPILQCLNPVALPSNFSFSISCSISDLDLNSNKLRLQFLDPKEKIIYDTGEIVLQIPPNIPANNLQVNIDIRNLVLRMEGLHKTVVNCNGETLGFYPIAVKSGDLNGKG